VIYATARAEGATVWTQDEDFEGLDHVRYVPRS
jgi:predicted nucleic acid-binding protein